MSELSYGLRIKRLDYEIKNKQGDIDKLTHQNSIKSDQVQTFCVEKQNFRADFCACEQSLVQKVNGAKKPKVKKGLNIASGINKQA